MATGTFQKMESRHKHDWLEKHFSDMPELPAQDLPRGADHAANRTIFTWHIDMDAVRRRVATELVQSIGNLRSRMAHEVSQRTEVNPEAHLLHD